MGDSFLSQYISQVRSLALGEKNDLYCVLWISIWWSEQNLTENVKTGHRDQLKGVVCELTGLYNLRESNGQVKVELKMRAHRQFVM